MSAPVTIVRDALERCGCDPHGPDHDFRSRCPVHGGDNPDALRVSEHADSSAGVWCYRGCATEDVIRTLGLRWADLFPGGHRNARPRRGIGNKPPRPADVALRLLRDHGIAYRATRDPQMWVAEECPCCHNGRRYPLWLLEGDRGRITFSCANGCDQEQVLAALPGLVEELER